MLNHMNIAERLSHDFGLHAAQPRGEAKSSTTRAQWRSDETS